MRLTLRCFNNMPLKSFLFWFSNEQSGFRCSELEALFRIFQMDIVYYNKRKHVGPFILMDLPSDEYAKKLMSRSVLAHSCVELWSSGENMEELHHNFKNNLSVTEPYLNNSFCLRVDTFGKTMSMTQKVDLIDTFMYLPLKGDVDLKNPEVKLQLIQYYGLDPNKAPPAPYNCYFGRWIADGQRHLIAKLSLKKRKFIGNTSMDPLLSLLMTNLALVKSNDLVFDPFAGSGSLLVAAAVMGGYIMGTDIDYLMLHGRTRPSRAMAKQREDDESIRANLIQYGVESQYLDILVADASRPTLRENVRFDAIITDPPYGVREPTERVGSFKAYKIKEEHVALHIPSKVVYSLCDIFRDLLNFSARHLTLGGRLVFWIPVSRDSYEEENLPSNPCFSVVSNCEQILTATASRRLIVMEKVGEPTESNMTTMDATAPMYRFQFYQIMEPDSTQTRKQKKKSTYENYGKATKRGQLME